MATQAELQWINANPDLAVQMFGSKNPADGVVGQFIQQWNTDNGGTPDPIDSAIIQEIQAKQSAAQSAATNATAQAGLGQPAADLTPPAADTGFGSLIPQTTSVAAPAVSAPVVAPPTLGTTTVAPATAPATSGGPQNYNQVQNANQGGQFSSVGNTVNLAQQVTGQDTNQKTTNDTTQNTSQTGSQQGATGGTTNNVQTGTTENVGNINTAGTEAVNEATKGTNVTNAIDTLGFGGLLKDAAAGVGASDAARSTFLTDVMNTGGGDAFQSQIDQGIRRAGSGPAMTGAGDSANARVKSYAVNEAARTNMGQRLNAAGQLTGPTGLTTLASAANPFIGKSETVDQNKTGNNTTTGAQTNTNTGTSNVNNVGSNTGWSNLFNSSNANTVGSSISDVIGKTTGFSNLLNQGSESNSGSTSGSSSQAGSGLVPAGQPVKSGGCVLCTAAIELKLSNHQRVLRRVIRHKMHVDHSGFARAAKGYFSFFTPVAAWLLKHPRTAKVLFPLAKAVVYEELRVSGRNLPLKPWASFVHWTGHCFCSMVGLLPVDGYVKDAEILRIAQKNNILFEVQS